MVKKTTLQRALKSNCDPRKYGDGILSDISKVNRMIARARYNRYNTMKKEGGQISWDSAEFANNNFNPPPAPIPVPNLGRFREAVKAFLDYLADQLRYYSRDYPDFSTNLRYYLGMLNDSIVTDGITFAEYATAIAATYRIIQDFRRYGRNSWEYQALNFAYTHSGLSSFVQYIRTWGERLGSTIAQGVRNLQNRTTHLLNRVANDYVGPALVNMGERVTTLGRRLSNRNRDTTEAPLQIEDGEMEEPVPEPVPTNTTATEDDSWLKEFVDDATEAYNKDVFENIGLRDVFPATNATQTDGQRNNIDDITNPDISTIRLADLVKIKTPAGKGAGRFGGSLFQSDKRKKKHSKRTINDEQLNAYVERIKRARNAPPVPDVGVRRPVINERDTESDFIRSVMPPKENYDQSFVIIDETTRPPSFSEEVPPVDEPKQEDPIEEQPTPPPKEEIPPEQPPEQPEEEPEEEVPTEQPTEQTPIDEPMEPTPYNQTTVEPHPYENTTSYENVFNTTQPQNPINRDPFMDQLNNTTTKKTPIQEQQQRNETLNNRYIPKKRTEFNLEYCNITDKVWNYAMCYTSSKKILEKVQEKQVDLDSLYEYFDTCPNIDPYEVYAYQSRMNDERNEITRAIWIVNNSTISCNIFDSMVFKALQKNYTDVYHQHEDLKSFISKLRDVSGMTPNEMMDFFIQLNSTTSSLPEDNDEFPTFLNETVPNSTIPNGTTTTDVRNTTNYFQAVNSTVEILEKEEVTSEDLNQLQDNLTVVEEILENDPEFNGFFNSFVTVAGDKLNAIYQWLYDQGKKVNWKYVGVGIAIIGFIYFFGPRLYNYFHAAQDIIAAEAINQIVDELENQNDGLMHDLGMNRNDLPRRDFVPQFNVQVVNNNVQLVNVNGNNVNNAQRQGFWNQFARWWQGDNNQPPPPDNNNQQPPPPENNQQPLVDQQPPPPPNNNQQLINVNQQNQPGRLIPFPVGNNNVVRIEEGALRQVVNELYNRYRNLIVGLDDQNQLLRLRVERIQGEFNQANVNHENQAQQIVQYRNQVDQQEVQIRELNDVMRGLRNVVRNLNHRNHNDANQIVRLQGEVGDLQNQIVNVNNEHNQQVIALRDQHNEQLINLNNQIAALRGDIERGEVNINDLFNIINRILDGVQNLENEMGFNQEQINHLIEMANGVRAHYNENHAISHDDYNALNNIVDELLVHVHDMNQVNVNQRNNLNQFLDELDRRINALIPLNNNENAFNDLINYLSNDEFRQMNLNGIALLVDIIRSQRQSIGNYRNALVNEQQRAAMAVAAQRRSNTLYHTGMLAAHGLLGLAFWWLYNKVSNQYQEKLSELALQALTYEENNKALNEKVSESLKKVEDLTDELNQSKKGNQALRIMVKQKGNQIESLNNLINTLVSNSTTQVQNITKLWQKEQRKTRLYEQQNLELKQQNYDQQAAYDELNRRNTKTEMLNDELQRNNTRLATDLEMEQEEHEKTKQERDSFKQQYEYEKERKEYFESSLHNLMIDYNDLNIQYEQTKETVDKLSSVVSQLEFQDKEDKKNWKAKDKEYREKIDKYEDAIVRKDYDYLNYYTSTNKTIAEFSNALTVTEAENYYLSKKVDEYYYANEKLHTMVDRMSNTIYYLTKYNNNNLTVVHAQNYPKYHERSSNYYRSIIATSTNINYPVISTNFDINNKFYTNIYDLIVRTGAFSIELNVYLSNPDVKKMVENEIQYTQGTIHVPMDDDDWEPYDTEELVTITLFDNRMHNHHFNDISTEIAKGLNKALLNLYECKDENGFNMFSPSYVDDFYTKFIVHKFEDQKQIMQLSNELGRFMDNGLAHYGHLQEWQAIHTALMNNLKMGEYNLKAIGKSIDYLFGKNVFNPDITKSKFSSVVYAESHIFGDYATFGFNLFFDENPSDPNLASVRDNYKVLGKDYSEQLKEIGKTLYFIYILQGNGYNWYIPYFIGDMNLNSNQLGLLRFLFPTYRKYKADVFDLYSAEDKNKFHAKMMYFFNNMFKKEDLKNALPN